MTNFYLRLLSSLIIAPIFIYALYEASFVFYLVLVVIILISSYEIFLNIKQRFLSLFLIILIFFFIYSLINVRGNSNESYFFLLWILLIVWTSDVFGYLVGKYLKGPKLTIYSPKKTISGFLGSIFFSQFSFLLLFFFLKNFNLNFKIFLLQLIICLVSIFGDIFFSYVKRINNIKDYSELIPGHGGLLDRLDGMIFAVIFYYFLLKFHVI